MQKLTLLNILLSGEEDVVSTIPTQRLVFLTKNLIECLHSTKASFGLKSEIFKTLSLILPALSEIYGSHWEECMHILSCVFRNTTGGEDALPLLVSSFKLFSQLKSISGSDGNEDAQDAWASQKGELFTALASTIDTFGKLSILLAPQLVSCLTRSRFGNTIPPAS